MLFDIKTFTAIHVVLSLVGISSGFVVMLGLLSARRLNGCTALFLASTAATRRSDQHLVWDTIHGHALRLAHHSPTAALEDVAEAAAPRVAAIVEGLRPGDGQRGVLVVTGGGVVALDLFDKPSTLAAYWDGLLAGYALDAVDNPGAGPAAFEPADARAFLDNWIQPLFLGLGILFLVLTSMALRRLLPWLKRWGARAMQTAHLPSLAGARGTASCRTGPTCCASWPAWSRRGPLPGPAAWWWRPTWTT